MHGLITKACCLHWDRAGRCSLTWAKGLGDYAGWVPSNIGSQPGNSRVNLSVSYLF